MLDRMQLGMIGLGRMGANMVRRLIKGGHECVVFDRSPESVAELAKQGAAGSSSLDEFLNKLKPPRAVWLMVPAAVVDSTLERSCARACKRATSSSMAAIRITSTTFAAPRNCSRAAFITPTSEPAAGFGAWSAGTA